jgi:hypothetical protein
MPQQERYRELPDMTYGDIKVGHVGAFDVFFLRTAHILWESLVEVITVKQSE